MKHLRKEYIVTGGDFSSVHLGMNIKRNVDGTINLSCQNYTGQAIERIQKLVGKECLKSYETPTKDNWEPELDDIPLVDKEGKKFFQRLVGICIWLVCIGRFDANFVINQLSRVTQASREGHVEDVIRVFGFLQKCQNQGVKTSWESIVSFVTN